MTDDLTTPIRWIEGHMSVLDDRAAGCEHAIRAAATPADAAPHRDELADIYRIRAQWALVAVLISKHARQKEHR